MVDSEIELNHYPSPGYWVLSRGARLRELKSSVSQDTGPGRGQNQTGEDCPQLDDWGGGQICSAPPPDAPRAQLLPLQGPGATSTTVQLSILGYSSPASFLTRELDRNRKSPVSYFSITNLENVTSLSVLLTGYFQNMQWTFPNDASHQYIRYLFRIPPLVIVWTYLL